MELAQSPSSAYPPRGKITKSTHKVQVASRFWLLAIRAARINTAALDCIFTLLFLLSTTFRLQ
jgi:hypothetical protein